MVIFRDRALREKLGSFLAKALNQELESKGYGNTCLKQTLKKVTAVYVLYGLSEILLRLNKNSLVKVDSFYSYRIRPSP